MHTGTKKAVVAAATKAAEKEGLRQEVKIRGLRSEIEKIDSVLQSAKIRHQTATLQAQIGDHTNRMAILLQDELNLKRLFGDFKPGEEKKLNKLETPSNLFFLPKFTKLMDAVSAVELADDASLASRMKRGIGLREKRVSELVKEIGGSGAMNHHKFIELEQNVYMLALLKGFASPSRRGKDLMAEYHDYAGETLQSGFADALLSYEPSLEAEWPSGWIANLKEGIANVETKLKGLRQSAASMGEQMGALSALDLKLAEKLNILGMKPEFPEDTAAFLKFISVQEDALCAKQNELAPIIKAIVEAAPEAKIEKFEGLKEAELRHLAAFWEAYSEYPSAADRLTHIYLVLKEWPKARKWAEEDIDRGFHASNMDWVTDSLRFAVKLGKAAGNKEWEDEFRKRLDAHQAASIPMIMMPNLFATHEPPRRKPHGGVEVA